MFNHHVQTVIALALLVLTAPAVHALGRDATAYGEDFVRLGSHWPEGGPVLESPVTEADTADAQRLARRLDAMELQDGPYGADLAEPLTDLARHYRAQGDYEQALAHYRRALHNVRVNDGLYSERQVPLVRELLNLYRLAGEYEALDDRYDYFFRLYGSGQPPFDEVRLRATLEYLRWQREAHRRGLRDGERDLLRLYEHNRDLLALVREAPTVPEQWQREFVFSQLRNLYLLQREIEPLVDSNSLGVVSAFPNSANNDRDFARDRLEAIDRTALSRGRQLLEELLHSLPGVDQYGRALVHRELGDWYQWNDSWRRAREHYREAIALLLAGGRDDLVRQWWGEPVELPDNGAFWRGDDSSDDAVAVRARLSVSDRGRPRIQDIMVASAEDESAARRLRRELADTRFRPAFRDGEPVTVESLERAYALYPD